MQITPTPTDEEAAAIVSAHEALWPKPAIAGPAPAAASPRWRFSGRWWSSPLLHRRARP